MTFRSEQSQGGQRPIFGPRSDDVFIVTYPRSGTSWLQMIIYQLMSDGDMNFMHISQHIPFFERAILRGIDLDGRKSPRMFKTHGQLSQIREISALVGKYIYVFREGRDVLGSYYRFYVSHLDYVGTFDDFFRLFMEGKVQNGRWFDHVEDAFRYRNRENVLILRYEDLLNDWARQIAKIVRFVGLVITPEQQARVSHRCSFEFMRMHEPKFDHAAELLWERLQDVGGKFFQNGKSGAGSNILSASQECEFIRAETLSEIGLYKT